MLDPCAGEGFAAAAVAEQLRLGAPRRQRLDENRQPTGESYPDRFRVRVIACELETGRAKKASRVLRGWDAVHRGDAFRLTWESHSGAAVLLLNPPYDDDPEWGRVEAKWLDYFSPALSQGGALLLVVPAVALAAKARNNLPLAEQLARDYDDVTIWRFPTPEWDQYGQVVVRARRRGARVRFTGDAAARYRNHAALLVNGAADPNGQLPLAGAAPLRIPFNLRFTNFRPRLKPVDMDTALAAFRPLDGVPFGFAEAAEGALGNVYPTALPPKPAHIALALASGHFNGHRLQPNADTPSHWPPIVLKGTYSRGRAELSTEVEKSSGRVLWVKERDVPRFALRLLTLDDYQFVTPVDKAERTEAVDLEEASVGDVVAGYSEALADLMAAQFPSIHDPFDPDQAYPLPTLSPSRSLKPSQAARVRASQKLLSRGLSVAAVEEVGTGKTIQAINIAGSLHPKYHAATQQALRLSGESAGGGSWASARLPVVRRTLVICPPHMLSTWRDEIAMAWPEARIKTIDRQGDELEDAEIYLLSRERAKLGHGMAPGTVVWSYIRSRNNFGDPLPRTPRADSEHRCPRCDWPVGNPERAATARLTCKAVRVSPLVTVSKSGVKREDVWARIAQRIAVALVRTLPLSDKLNEMAADHRILIMQAKKTLGIVRPGATESLEIIRALLRAGVATLEPASDQWWSIFAIIQNLAPLAGVVPAARDLMRRAAEYMDTKHSQERESHRPSRHIVAAIVGLDGLSKGVTEYATAVIEAIDRIAAWSAEPQICGEPLFQAIPEPRRYPLARWLNRRAKRRFDLVVIDEAHEAANDKTAQQRALHRLVELRCPTIMMSGSFMTGYASSMFGNWWALSRQFREAFGRDERGTFIDRYGLQKYLRKPPTDKKRFGAVTDREEWSSEIIGEAPGVVPTFIIRFGLPMSVVMHKSDLEADLPRSREHQVKLVIDNSAPDPRDVELLNAARALEADIVAQIEEDRGSEWAGKLWGAMGEATSYMDRCHTPFEARYPADCGERSEQLVHRAALFPPDYVTPKERWILGQVEQLRGEGRRVLLFVRHVSSDLPGRLAHLLRERLPVDLVGRVEFLSAGKPAAAKRKEHIERLVALGTQVLIVNPETVKTGLNALVAFSASVWVEPPNGIAVTVRQANGRTHRIGQTREVDYFYTYYAGTTQEDAVAVTAAKVTASLQFDGLSVLGALEAAGAGENDVEAAEAAMSFGQAVYLRAAARKSGRISNAT